MSSMSRVWMAVGFLGLAQAGAQAACLTNASDVVGNPVFGATVQTFINLGVNPASTCIENALWTDPAGFALGTYVKGSDGQGFGYDPANLGAYNGATTPGGNANGRDFYWVQDTGNQTSFTGGAIGGRPSQGIIWDLGGLANQAVVFPFVDHGPVPGEVLENSVWLSNDPNADDAGWTQAVLKHVFADGWSADPNVADGFVAVYGLAGNASFRYVSVTWGGPNAVVQDGDNEIDAVGGLTVAGCGVNDTRPECQRPLPEPDALALLALALSAATWAARSARRQRG